MSDGKGPTAERIAASSSSWNGEPLPAYPAGRPLVSLLRILIPPHARLEETALEWAATIATKSPQAIRMLKFAFNLADDGLAGQQVFAGEATRLAYMTAEAQEGRDAFLEHRAPRWEDYPYYY